MKKGVRVSMRWDFFFFLRQRLKLKGRKKKKKYPDTRCSYKINREVELKRKKAEWRRSENAIK